jgi:hypothetical protein
MDSLRHFELLVDVTGNQLVPCSSLSAFAGGDNMFAVIQQKQEFPTVIQPFTVSSSPKHHIGTTGCPVTAKCRRLDRLKLKAAKEEFSKMLAAGVIRRYSSFWASPLQIVCKKDAPPAAMWRFQKAKPDSNGG